MCSYLQNMANISNLRIVLFYLYRLPIQKAPNSVDSAQQQPHVFLQESLKYAEYWPLHPPNLLGLLQMVFGVMVQSGPFGHLSAHGLTYASQPKIQSAQCRLTGHLASANIKQYPILFQFEYFLTCKDCVSPFHLVVVSREVAYGA